MTIGSICVAAVHRQQQQLPTICTISDLDENSQSAPSPLPIWLLRIFKYIFVVSNYNIADIYNMDQAFLRILGYYKIHICYGHIL